MRWAMILGLPACAALLGGLLVVQRQRQPEAAARALRSQPSAPRAAASAAAPGLVESPARAEPPLAEQRVEGPPTAPVSAPTPRDTRHGHLSINTRPWSTVYLGSRVLGTTPLADVSVPRTALTLKLVDRDGNVHLRKVARTRKAERSAFYDLEAPKKRVRRAR